MKKDSLKIKQVDPNKSKPTEIDELCEYIDKKYGVKNDDQVVIYKKDRKWVGALMLGLIGIATCWTIFVPLACIWGIVEIYEEG